MPSPEFLLTEAIMWCDSTLGAILVEAALHYSDTGCLQTGNNTEGDRMKRLNVSQQSLHLLVTHYCFTAASPWPVLPWPSGLVTLFYLPLVAAWPLTLPPTIFRVVEMWRSDPLVCVNFCFCFFFNLLTLFSFVRWSQVSWHELVFASSTRHEWSLRCKQMWLK